MKHPALRGAELALDEATTILSDAALEFVMEPRDMDPEDDLFTAEQTEAIRVAVERWRDAHRHWQHETDVAKKIAEVDKLTSGT